MVSYGIGVVPLIKLLKVVYSDVTQPCYNDNACAQGTFDNIGLYFSSLKKFFPGHGYYPNPLKSVLIIHPDNPAARLEFGLHHRFKVLTRTRYMEGFVGDDKSKRDSLKYQMSEWVKNICTGWNAPQNLRQGLYIPFQ